MTIKLKIASCVLLFTLLLTGCSKINIDNTLKNAKDITYDSSLITKQDNLTKIAAQRTDTIIDYTKVDKSDNFKNNDFVVNNMFDNMIESPTINLWDTTWTVNNQMDEQNDIIPCAIVLSAKLSKPTDFTTSKKEIKKIYDYILDYYKGFIYTENIYENSEKSFKKNPIVLLTKTNNNIIDYYVTIETGYKNTKEYKGYYVTILTMNTDALYRLDKVSAFKDEINALTSRLKSVGKSVTIKTAELNPEIGYILGGPKKEEDESPQDKNIENNIIYK